MATPAWFSGEELAGEADGSQQQPNTEYSLPTPEDDVPEEQNGWTDEHDALIARVAAINVIIAAMSANDPVGSPSYDAPLPS